jgi:hypothetical protein
VDLLARDLLPGDERAVRRADVEQHPAAGLLAQLGVARRRVEILVRVEGDLVVGVAPEAQARHGLELLALARAAARQVIDHDLDGHGG